jgi:hypothetical protein
VCGGGAGGAGRSSVPSTRSTTCSVCTAGDTRSMQRSTSTSAAMSVGGRPSGPGGSGRSQISAPARRRAAITPPPLSGVDRKLQLLILMFLKQTRDRGK